MSASGEMNLSLATMQSENFAAGKIPDVPPQFLDFGSQMRFSRLLSIYRRGSRIFSSHASLDELITLLAPQLENGRVRNDFEWKTLLLLSAAAFHNCDSGTRIRTALAAQRCEKDARTKWSRMCMSACLAQVRQSEMTTLAGYLDDLEHVGSTAAVMISQAAYSAGNRGMLAKAVARLTLYEEAYSFPGHPNVMYHLALAMQQVLESGRLDDVPLLGMLRRMESDYEQQAFRLGLKALRQFSPLPREQAGGNGQLATG